MELNMSPEQGCFQKRPLFFDFTIRRWIESAIMCSPLIYGFWKSNRWFFWWFGFFFSISSRQSLKGSLKHITYTPIKLREFHYPTTGTGIDTRNTKMGCANWTSRSLDQPIILLQTVNS